MPLLRSIDDAIETLYRLNVGVVGTGQSRHERPHKPVLLLAVLDLIALNRAEAARVPWSQDLRERFAVYFDIVRTEGDKSTPENPFLYLKSDKFWHPFERQQGMDRPLENTPTVSQAKAGTIFAKVIGGLELFLMRPDQRTRLREAIIARYFPASRAELIPLFAEAEADSAEWNDSGRCNEDELDSGLPGRDPAFRRIVLEAYDYQCAACGLRIKLPDADVTFVDGAHLIPFGLSRNDHPTNGLALCKNHHWAMDRFLIAPTPDGVWAASHRLDARRSLGEQELVALRGQPLLPPHDEAFRPHREGLEWRAKRLYA